MLEEKCKLEIEVLEVAKNYICITNQTNVNIFKLIISFQLHDQEKKENQEYLLTARLNQDVNENLFSVIRQRGGYCRNPSAQRFRCTFRQVTINSLLRSAETSNCEEDNDFFLSLDESLLTTKQPRPSGVSEKHQEEITQNSESEEDVPACVPQQTDLETCSESMFAGYCASKLFKIKNCLRCRDILILDKPLEKGTQDTLIIFRQFEKRPESSGLCAPTNLCKVVCHTALLVFKKHFKKHYFKRGIKNYMINKVVTILDSEVKEYFCCNYHLTTLLHILYNAKIYSCCKQMISDIGASSEHGKSSVRKSKLAIFKNQ